MKIESRRGTVGVRKAIRQGSAEEEVRKHRDRLLLCFINPRVGKKRGLQLPWDLLQNSPLLLCPPVHPSPIFLTDTENL